MPNAYVFPGGVMDPSDFSEDWLDVFKKCGYNPSDLLKEFRNEGPQPEIYTNKSYPIIPEVGFRIGAIREAFEECGLLLTHHLPYKELNKEELTKWQEIVHQDASQFVVMFQEMGGCPAIWDLHEWVAWLTPTHFGSRRFNTAFFITFMEKIPKIVPDGKEIEDIKVVSPSEIMEQWRSKSLILPPPQLYEVTRLHNFNSYEELKRFSQKRGQKGMDTIFPIRISTNNGILTVFQGDDLYPEEPDYTGEQEQLVMQESIEELRNRAKNFHRFEIRSPYDIHLQINVTPKYGHKPIRNFNELLKTKL